MIRESNDNIINLNPLTYHNEIYNNNNSNNINNLHHINLNTDDNLLEYEEANESLLKPTNNINNINTINQLYHSNKHNKVEKNKQDDQIKIEDIDIKLKSGIKQDAKQNLRIKIIDNKILAKHANDKSLNNTSINASVYESANSSLNINSENQSSSNNNNINIQKTNYFSEDSSSYYSDTNSNFDNLNNSTDLNNDMIYQHKDLIEDFIKNKNFEKLDGLEKENFNKVIEKRKLENEKKWEKIKIRVEKIKEIGLDNSKKNKKDVLDKENNVNLFLANTTKGDNGYNIIEETEFKKKYYEDGFCGYNLYYER